VATKGDPRETSSWEPRPACIFLCRFLLFDSHYWNDRLQLQHSSPAHPGWAVLDGGIGSGWNWHAELYGHGAKRFAKQGRHLGPIGRRLHGCGLWLTFGHFQCIRYTHHIYGPLEPTQPDWRYSYSHFGRRYHKV